MSGEGLEAVASRMTAPMQQAHTVVCTRVACHHPSVVCHKESGTNNKMANKKNSVPTGF